MTLRPHTLLGARTPAIGPAEPAGASAAPYGPPDDPPYDPPSGPLRLRHLDDQLLVVEKPAGLLCVPGRGAAKADCLASRVAQQVADALVVHRLDMGTSGLVVMARGAAMQRALSMAFAERLVHKTYVAVVAGLPEADAGEIDLPLGADWPRRPRQQVDHARGKSSLTHWQVLARDPVAGTARLALKPVTGRSHQLRVHLAAIGHPILGDELYAPSAVYALSVRLCLHACTLVLPAVGQMTAPLRCHSAPAF